MKSKPKPCEYCGAPLAVRCYVKEPMETSSGAVLYVFNVRLLCEPCRSEYRARMSAEKG